MNAGQQLFEIVAKLMQAHQVEIKSTYGRDLIDFPLDKVILETLILTSNEDEIELSTTTDAARPAFEWLVEITVRRPDSWNHFLLRPDYQIIEAYGRKTTAADKATVARLLDYLAELA